MPGSGRRKGVPNALGRAAREYLAAESGYLDMLARVSVGKAVRMAGPTGKKTWHYPDWADRKWALELIASKCIPTMTGAELSGPDGVPLPGQTRFDELFGEMETARRLAFLLSKGEVAKKELEKADESAAEPEPERLPKPEPEAEAAPEAPAEPPLPMHAFIYLEQGERERSGERAWLCMESKDMILKTFHGVDARQQARSWVAEKYRCRPVSEIEVPLFDEETP